MTEQDLAILAIERQWWKYAGSKEQHVRATLDLSPVRYHQALNRLIDTEAALAYDPVTVGRLRRLRDRRLRHKPLREQAHAL